MNKSTETGLQDLLFNGAVGCLLLFIIYAIKANGFSVIQSIADNGVTGEYQANASLPIDSEKLNGEMISYRKVYIDGLTETQQQQMLNGDYWAWEGKDIQDRSVQPFKNGVVLSVSFTKHPKPLRLNLSLASASRHNLNFILIEGEELMGERVNKQPGGCRLKKGGQYINNLEIEFNLLPDYRIGDTCRDELIKLN